MPTAFAQSREFARRAIAGLRGGSALDQPGTELKVEPFDATNVSTPAAILKLITSVRANRRHEANAKQALADKELEREKTRAEIAHIRAEATKAERPTAASVGTVTDQPVTIGGKTYPKGTSHATLNAIGREARDQLAAGRTGKTTAARAQIAALDERIKTEAKMHVAPAMARLSPYVAALTSGTPELRTHALKVIRNLTGRDFSAYGMPPMGTEGKPVPLSPSEGIAAQKAAMGELEGWASTKATNILGQRYAPLRQQYQATIDQMAQGDAAAAANPEDPFGVLGDEQP